MKHLRAIGNALAVLVGGGSAAESAGLPIAGLPARAPGPFASYQAPPPSPVGGLPLQGLEVGGVGPSGGAGAASYDSAGYFVSASSYPANAPVEDRFDVRQWQAPAPPAERPGASAAPSPALLAAVFDGHGGWQAAEHARRVLLERLGEELSGGGAAPSEAAAIASALVRAFAHTERTFIDAIRPAYALGFGEVAHVGACALAAVLTQSTAVVANAGDCRAVLGHLCLGHPPEHRTAREGEAGVDGHAAAAAALLEATGGGGAKGALPTEVPGAASTPPFLILPEPSWRWRRLAPLDPPPSPPPAPSASAHGASSTLPLPPMPSPAGLPLPHPFYLAAIPMSLDNNAREAREKARLAAEHPGESDVVVCRRDSPTSCYVKSRLQPTRALGDAYLKHAEFNEDGGRFRGRHIKPPFTPPYISACVFVGVVRVLLFASCCSGALRLNLTRSLFFFLFFFPCSASQRFACSP